MDMSFFYRLQSITIIIYFLVQVIPDLAIGILSSQALP